VRRAHGWSHGLGTGKPRPILHCLVSLHSRIESPWQSLWPSLLPESDPRAPITARTPARRICGWGFEGAVCGDSMSKAIWAILDLLLHLLQRHDWCADEVWRAQSMMVVLHKHSSRAALKGEDQAWLRPLTGHGLIGARCIMYLSTTMIEPGSPHAVSPWSMNSVIIGMLAACYLIFDFYTWSLLGLLSPILFWSHDFRFLDLELTYDKEVRLLQHQTCWVRQGATSPPCCHEIHYWFPQAPPSRGMELR
jgi:hypothetical protein